MSYAFRARATSESSRSSTGTSEMAAVRARTADQAEVSVPLGLTWHLVAHD